MNKQKFRHIHHCDYKTLQEMFKEYSPVFVLTTGRSGSKLLAQMIMQSNSTDAYHEPFPTLQLYPDFAYHNQNKKKLLKEIFLAARTELILKSFVQGKLYFESNQCMAFFAFQIKNIFPKAKFIHIVRHPGDFVVSALKKGWYRNDTIWEYGRIKKKSAKWTSCCQEEKLAWLWNETNSFIEKFKKAIPPEDVFFMKFSELVTDVPRLIQLLQFIGIQDISREQLLSAISAKVNEVVLNDWEPPNLFKTTDISGYSQWPEERKMIVRDKALLAKEYNFEI